MSAPHRTLSNRPLPIFWLCCLVLALIVAGAAIEVTLQAQMWISLSMLGFAFLLQSVYRRISGRDALRLILRLIIVLASVYITLRYFFWRTFYTLDYYDPASFLGALILYAAEVYGITLYLFGLFVNINPLDRKPIPLPTDTSLLPTVDVFVPSYNEEPALLETTLLAARQIRYPKQKLRVYLLDDGGTDKLRNHPDENIRTGAQQRHEQLMRLCEQLGVGYLTRADNSHAKAGNINAALPRTDADLILFLDADHVPTVDILEHSVGWFLEDQKLFLVQTPHFFITPDPVEWNLETHQRMPSENEMFYMNIQRGLDFWNSSFFCGSAGLLRRRHLQGIGGFSTDSITEDAATSLLLHKQGLNSVYLCRPLISGLQPPTYGDFVRQRVRWAQGMTQIFFRHNPLIQSGLRPWQRLAYLSSAYFWFFGFSRIVFVLAPVAYLVFGLKIYGANLTEVLFYTLPHIVASLMATNLLFGEVRWPFISELYEYMLSLFTTRGVGKALRNLKTPKFVVTPKTAQLDREFISELAPPYYFLLLITIATLGAGVYRYMNFPANQDATIINIGWETFNLIILLGALGALLERRQRRGAPRVPVELPASIVSSGMSIPCCLTDVSVTGVRLSVSAEHLDALSVTQRWVIDFNNPATRANSRVPVVPVSFPKTKDKGAAEMLVRVRFAAATQQEKEDVVALVHGDSNRWENYLLQRDKGVSVLRGLWVLLKIGGVHTLRHLHWIVIQGAQVLYILIVNTARAFIAWIGAVASGASPRP